MGAPRVSDIGGPFSALLVGRDAVLPLTLLLPLDAHRGLGRVTVPSSPSGVRLRLPRDARYVRPLLLRVGGCPVRGGFRLVLSLVIV